MILILFAIIFFIVPSANSGVPALSALDSFTHQTMIYIVCDDASGTAARDLTKYGNNGSLLNGATFISGKTGLAVSGATGGGNQLITIADNPNFKFSLTTPFLAAMTFSKTAPFTALNAEMAFGKAFWGGAGTGWKVGWGMQGLEIDVQVIGTNNVVWNSLKVNPNLYNDGAPHSIIAYYDGLNTAKSWTICMDKNCDSNLKVGFGTPPITGSIDSTQPMRFGGSGTATIEFRSKWIDNFIVSSGTWTIGEIHHLSDILVGNNANKND